jgi:Transposase
VRATLCIITNALIEPDYYRYVGLRLLTNAIVLPSVGDSRWDKKAGLEWDALSSQVIDALEAWETGRPAMKKLTTTMMQQALNKQDWHLTVGLDLRDRSSFYCVLDAAGDVLMEQRLSTTPKAIKEIFGAMPRSRIALETGTHSPWVSRLLSELGHEAIVAHARSVRLIGEDRRKDDRIDARTPARLARVDPSCCVGFQLRSAKSTQSIRSFFVSMALTAARMSSSAISPM